MTAKPGSDPLAKFLYILLRDHLPSGTVESIMEGHVDKAPGQVVFTNNYLLDYAEDIAARLRVRPFERVPAAKDEYTP